MSSLLESSIIDVIDNHSSLFFNKKNVIGVGLGFKTINNINTLEPSLHILVKEKIPLNKLYTKEIIPSNFFGIKTDVISTGNISSQLDKFPLKATSYSRYPSYNYPSYNYPSYNYPLYVPQQLRNLNRINTTNPLIIGSSIGPSTVQEAGTLGAFVFGNNDNYPYILSNNHVLANINKLPPGTTIVYPGKTDAFYGRNIAKLSRCVNLYLDSPYLKNTVDCAIAKLNENILYDLNIPGIGIIKNITFPKIGDSVTKVGRTTGQTIGTITTIHAEIKVDMHNNNFCIFSDAIRANLISRPGDSGSLVVDYYSKNALGLLYASSPTESFFSPISTVLKNLNVHFEY